MQRRLAMLAMATVAAVAAGRVDALSFTFNFSANTSQPIIDSFNAAAARWSANFSDPVNLTLSIEYTDTLATGVLAATSSTKTSTQYSQVRTKLTADASSADDTLAVSSLQGGISTSFLINHTSLNGGALYLDNNGNFNNRAMSLTTANAKALGLSTLPATFDATMQLSSKFNWDYDPSSGIASGSYDLVGLVTHELGHALGFGSGVDILDANPGMSETSYTYLTTLDLFRFSAESVAYGSGIMDWSADTRTKYFSIDGGATSIASFATGTTFGDGMQASHWKNGQGIGIMNPTIGSGQLLSISATDLRAFDVIGYDRDYTWEWAGGATGSWQTALKWNSDSVPNNLITARFDGSGVNPAVTFSSNAQAGGMLITSDQVTLNLSGRTVAVSGAVSIGDTAGKSGGLIVSGSGTLSADAIYVGGAAGGAGGQGSLSIGVGSGVNVASTLRVYPGAPNAVTFSGGSLTAASIVNEGSFVLSDGTLNVTGSFANSGSATLGGIQHWSPGTTLSNSDGILAMLTDAGSSAAPGPVLIVSGGAVQLESGQHLSGVEITGGSVEQAPGQMLVTHGLSIAGGTLDVSDGGMVLFFDGASPYSEVAADISSGAIFSSAPALAYPTTFALLENDRLHLADWLGEPLLAASGDYHQLILQYTYVGDVNLDGTVSSTDLAYIVANLSHTGTWIDGDVNHDGLVSAADYTATLANLGAGSGGAGNPNLMYAVQPDFSGITSNMIAAPEPGSLMAMGAGCILSMRRRRPRAQKALT